VPFTFHFCQVLLSQVEVMRLILLLCCAAPGAAFVAKVAPSAASKSGPGRHGDSPRSSSSAISGRCPSTRRPLFPDALKERPDDRGRGDTPGENSTGIRAVDKKVEVVEEDIQAVGREIGAVEKKIEAVEAALSGGPPYLGITDRDLLLKKEEQLWEEQFKLREEEFQLREEEILLLKKLPAAAVSLAGTYGTITQPSDHCCLRLQIMCRGA